MELFEHDGIFYKIEKQKYEPIESQMERVEWIFKKMDSLICVSTEDMNFENIKFLSIIWLNVKNLKCEYSKELMEKIKIEHFN